MEDLPAAEINVGGGPVFGRLSADDAAIAWSTERESKHGLEPKPEGGAPEGWRPEVAHGKLVVTVADTGVPVRPRREPRVRGPASHIATQLRIYRPAGRVRIGGNSPTGTRVTIVVTLQDCMTPRAVIADDVGADARASCAPRLAEV